MSILVLTSDTLIGTPATGNLEYNGQFFGTDSNASRAQMQRLVLETSKASTSGTSIEFTGLPAWVKRITVNFQGVSTNGTSQPIIQLGTGSTTYTTSGYVGSTTDASTVVATTAHSTGVYLQSSGAAATVMQGSVILTTSGSNVWAAFGVIGRSNTTNTSLIGGTIALAAALTAVRITTVNGTDTFDAGSINILYEG